MTRTFYRGATAGLLATGMAGFGGAALAEAMRFDSPSAATDAVIAALEAQDRDALIAVFGPENEDVILTGGEADDREVWGEFLRDYRTMHRIAADGDGRSTLYVGRDQWPFPAPLVDEGGEWHFDAEAAREEVLLRRIGRNELDVIELLREYVRAQAAYRVEDPDDDGLPTFAASILSSPVEHDGLYWDAEEGGPVSPVGDFMARAAADGYSWDGEDMDPEPYLGYYYRILTRQGPSAPGGEMDYMLKGHMVAGHALLAVPADYGDSGITSFMVGEAGVVYEADLGDETLDVTAEIDAFDPGEGWSPVEE